MVFTLIINYLKNMHFLTFCLPVYFSGFYFKFIEYLHHGYPAVLMRQSA